MLAAVRDARIDQVPVCPAADGSIALDSQPVSRRDIRSGRSSTKRPVSCSPSALHPALSWNGPAWSAALEFLRLDPVRRRGPAVPPAGATTCSLASACWPDCCSTWFRPHTPVRLRRLGASLRTIFSFFAGCLVYDWRVRSSGHLVAPNVLEGLLRGIGRCLRGDPRRPGGTQYAFPILAAIRDLRVFVRPGARSRPCCGLRRCRNSGCGPTSIYMIHTFVFQLIKMIASFVGHKTHIELVGWHKQREADVAGNAGSGAVAVTDSFRRPRRAGRPPLTLSLDRESLRWMRPGCASPAR